MDSFYSILQVGLYTLLTTGYNSHCMKNSRAAVSLLFSLFSGYHISYRIMCSVLLGTADNMIWQVLSFQVNAHRQEVKGTKSYLQSVEGAKIWPNQLSPYSVSYSLYSVYCTVEWLASNCRLLLRQLPDSSVLCTWVLGCTRVEWGSGGILYCRVELDEVASLVADPPNAYSRTDTDTHTS